MAYVAIVGNPIEFVDSFVVTMEDCPRVEDEAEESITRGHIDEPIYGEWDWAKQGVSK